MIWYRRVHQEGHSAYVAYRRSFVLGYVRLADRDSARPHRWEFSRTADDWDWTYSAISSRTAATNHLLELCGLEPIALPAAQTSRARRVSGGGRAFGVEMELTGPGASHIISALAAHGISCVDLSDSYRATNGRSWELKHDGSVGGHGLELVSPKLRGTQGFAELETVCRALNEAGATVDRSCGLHVHHDMRELTAEQIKRQVLAFVDRQQLIRRMVSPSRRTNDYCPEWGYSHRSSLANFTTEGRYARTIREISYIGPRGAINLQSYSNHGTAEIRYAGGSTNFRKISAWVRFGQALFAAAEAQVDLPTSSLDNLLAALCDYGLTVEDSATLLRFERVGETRSQVEATIAEANEMLEEVGN